MNSSMRKHVDICDTTAGEKLKETGGTFFYYFGSITVSSPRVKRIPSSRFLFGKKKKKRKKHSKVFCVILWPTAKKFKESWISRGRQRDTTHEANGRNLFGPDDARDQLTLHDPYPSDPRLKEREYVRDEVGWWLPPPLPALPGL